ncbi:MAG: beta-lactamase family protein [Verrucomicrobiales bacterium]|jgi:CubicO group peptidase (beta-lactamase class C family)|nr:beta-lactamase family protein [Verrucomicrobiales bacterium]
MNPRFFARIVFLTQMLSWCLPAPANASGKRTNSSNDVPTFTVTDDLIVNEALVLGPFPNPAPAAAGARRGGFDADYLPALGGEARAGVSAGTVVEVSGTWRATAKIIKGKKLDLQTTFSPNEYVVAYAFVNLRSDRARKMTCYFGSDDYAKIWLNGELVYEIYRNEGRGVNPEEDKFSVQLRPGINRLTVKVEQALSGWGMALRLTDEGLVVKRERNERFMQRPLSVKTPYSSRLLVPGKLPELVFENPELAELLLDLRTFKTRWFDADLNEVSEAKTPGFYCAYAEAKAKNGLMFRRVVPVFVMEDAYRWRRIAWSERNPGAKDFFAWQPAYGDFDRTAWDAHRNLVQATLSFGRDEASTLDEMPMFMAELALDKEPAGAWRETPYGHVHAYLTQLRRKVMERPPVRDLQPPVADSTATALRAGTEAEAGFKPGSVKKMRASLTEWSEKTGYGFVALVARRGVIVLHEAFSGSRDNTDDGVDPQELTGGRLTIASRLETASVTKLHTGVLLGRFIDQGLVSLDDPVSKYFPDFPATGAQAITVRQLMNHTTGLKLHRYHMGLQGMANPFLDTPARWMIETAASDMAYENYNGFGIDLAGKVMEDVTGKPAFRIMREGLFEPLGQDKPTIVDLGYGLRCMAIDLARVAEMLRQEGAYGGKRYFSRETFAKLLPIPIGRYNPFMDAEDGKLEYGVGISWMRDPKEGTRHEPLGKNVFGHGSATGAVMRIAPDHELIVVMARYTTGGPSYYEYLGNFLQTVADGMKVAAE